MKRTALLMIGLCVLTHLLAFTLPNRLSLERIPDETKQTSVQNNMRLDVRTGIPMSLYLQRTPVQGANAEDMARGYLREKASLLGLGQNDEMQYLRTITTPGSQHVHMQQMHGGIPVWHGRTVISINRQNEVVHVSNGVQRVQPCAKQPLVSEATAMSAARRYLGVHGEVHTKNTRLVVYAHSTPHRLAWQVSLFVTDEPLGDWELLIDAITGEVFRVQDKLCYVDGTGWVFNPDPVADAGTVYGEPGFNDDGDSDSDSLTAHTHEVTLHDITLENGEYRLEGPWACIIDVDGPYSGLFEQDSNNFCYPRSADEFEAVNLYYHIDDTMRYLNNTLDFDVSPFQYEGGVQYDPHALNGGTNAYYSPTGGLVAFGSPNDAVDAGEDTSIIRHEVGHGIHDWITNGALSQNEGLSEGIADYWGQSHNRSCGCFTPLDMQYDWFCMWGLMPAIGINYLRVTNFPGHYPEALGGGVHHDGQLWSSSMMTLYDLLGRDVSDHILWEGISMTSFDSGQMDAAYAVMQADQNLYGGAHLATISQVFADRGYITSPLMAGFTANQTAGPVGLEVQFTDQSFASPDPIITWEWDFDGDGAIDSYEQNPSFVYQSPGIFSVTLTVHTAQLTDSFTIDDYISVNSGVFIFDSEDSLIECSGAYIRDYLLDLGVNATYSHTIPSSLEGYTSLFLSFGNEGSYVPGPILDDNVYQAILDYVENGGNVFLESNSFFSTLYLYNVPNYTDIWAEFGITQATFHNENHALGHIIGCTSSLAHGALFEQSSQSINWYIDTYTPMPTAQALFEEEDYGCVGVQNTGPLGQHTVCFNYALCNLQDGQYPSTRAYVLNRILAFFEIPVFEGSFYVMQNTGLAPLTTMFFDTSAAYPPTNSWEWDFDSDGTVDSYAQTPEHTFTVPGDYTTTLTVSNGIDSQEIVQDNIHVFEIDSAIEFVSEDQMVMVPVSPDHNLTTNLTLEAWIKPLSWGFDNLDNRILSKDCFSLYLHEFGTPMNNESLVFRMTKDTGGPSFACTPEGSISLDEWQHVAVTYDGAGDLHMYINGEDMELTLLYTNNGPIQDNDGQPLIIGNTRSLHNGFEGVIDEVRVWNITRSQQEIEATMRQTLGGHDNGLVGYWPMCEAFGDLLIDHSPSGNDAVITGAQWAQGVDYGTPIAGGTDAPAAFGLQGCYPNPFNPTTTVRFSLAQPEHVQLVVYNIRGQEVRRLVQGTMPAGQHEVVWDGATHAGQPAASGVYLLRLRAGNRTATSKALLLK